MADYMPINTGGLLSFTMTASAAITGGQVLIATGTNTAGPATAASGAFIGVAGHDAASGSRVTVWPLPGAVHEVVAAGSVAAGDSLVTGAAGTVATAVLAPTGSAAAGTWIGTALTAAANAAKLAMLAR